MFKKVEVYIHKFEKQWKIDCIYELDTDRKYKNIANFYLATARVENNRKHVEVTYKRKRGKFEKKPVYFVFQLRVTNMERLSGWQFKGFEF